MMKMMMTVHMKNRAKFFFKDPLLLDRSYAMSPGEMHAGMGAGPGDDGAFLYLPHPQAMHSVHPHTLSHPTAMGHPHAMPPHQVFPVVSHTSPGPMHTPQGPHAAYTKPVLKRSLMDICQMSALSGTNSKRYKASPEETGIVNTLCELEHVNIPPVQQQHQQQQELPRFDQMGPVLATAVPTKGGHPMQINFLV